MNRVERRLASEGLKAKLVLQIHDELLIEVPKEELDAVCSIVREEMSSAADLKVPLEVDVNVGMNWYESK